MPDRKHHRSLSSRSVNVCGLDLWGRAVDAWMDEALAVPDVVWDGIIEDLNSDYEAYSNVSSMGRAA
ncbi:hypothetical protein ACK8N7_37105 [Streptomyces griseobrunneus]